MRTYITTSIPYVNGAPHLGHALEFVQVDAYARNLEAGELSVRVQSGTDDHALKNTTAAKEQGLSTRDLVDRNSQKFVDLAHTLNVLFDQFVRTSVDATHRQGVEELWRRCAAAGDLYTKDYVGLYCPGCEQFYTELELEDGYCPEHKTKVETVVETNWFFRLSKYRDRILALIESNELVIVPEQRRQEVIGVLRGPLHDLSVSRAAERAQGWGIEVPDDPSQTVYVWFDALANYITGLGWPANTRAYQTWWEGDSERVHAVGKGIARFHAVYWVAFLLSAELPLPTRIWVHDYLTVNGDKISKSTGVGVDPVQLVEKYGEDAVRWCLLRDVAYTGTTDYTDERLVARYNADLANTIGNLVSRTVALLGDLDVSTVAVDSDVLAEAEGAEKSAYEAFTRFEFARGCEALVSLAEYANRYIEATAPWHQKKALVDGVVAGSEFEQTLANLAYLCKRISAALSTVIPKGASHLWEQIHRTQPRTAVFPRITL